MEVAQWADEEWRELENKFGAAETSRQEQDKLIESTEGQEEHPEWYDSPCDCDLCRSYGD